MRARAREKARRTRNAEDRRANRDAALAHRTPEQRGLPASARTQGNVSMCTSSSMPDKSVRMQAASGARLLGSWCAHATSAGRGIVAGLPALKKTPRMMESRPKAPWCEGDRPSRPSPHHGAASSRMELARASTPPSKSPCQSLLPRVPRSRESSDAGVEGQSKLIRMHSGLMRVRATPVLGRGRWEGPNASGAATHIGAGECAGARRTQRAHAIAERFTARRISQHVLDLLAARGKRRGSIPDRILM